MSYRMFIRHRCLYINQYQVDTLIFNKLFIDHVRVACGSIIIKIVMKYRFEVSNIDFLSLFKKKV